MKRGQGNLEEILSRRRSIMDSREISRLAGRYGTSAENARAILLKLGFELGITFGGRRIWRKR
jgi:hypothetical protein